MTRSGVVNFQFVAVIIGIFACVCNSRRSNTHLYLLLFVTVNLKSLAS